MKKPPPPARPPPARPAAAAVAAATREVELKLLAADSDLDRLAQLATRQCRLLAPVVTRRVRTIYYDTPDLALAASGVALRLRQDGDRWLMTLKTRVADAAAERAAVAVRREWETPLDGPTLNPALLDSIEAGGMAPAGLRDRLAPQFETLVLRTELLLDCDDGAVVEMAIDRGTVVAGDAVISLGEIELELKQGPVGRLFDLAIDLHARAPLRISAENKADMGLRLLTGRHPQPVPAGAMGLSRLLTGGEALRHLMRAAIRHLMDNLACASAWDDGEGMHQIRLALRRLRLALRLIAAAGDERRGAALLKESRWLSARLVRPPRWDNLLAQLSGDEDLAEIAAAAVAMRDDAGNAATRCLQSPRFTLFLLSLARWVEDDRWRRRADPAFRRQLEKPVDELAPAQLSLLYALAQEELRQLPPDDGAAADSLRRRLRRLRLAAECYRGLYPPAVVQPFTDQLTQILHPLNERHHQTTAWGLCDELAVKHPELRDDIRQLRRTWRKSPPADRPAALPAPFWDAPAKKADGKR